MKLPVEKDGFKHVYNIYNIRTEKRNGLKDFLSSKGVSTAVYYPMSLHLQKVYEHLDYKEGDFPNSEKVCREVLALPVFPGLTEEEIKFIVDCISDFCGGRK